MSDQKPRDPNDDSNLDRKSDDPSLPNDSGTLDASRYQELFNFDTDTAAKEAPPLPLENSVPDDQLDRATLIAEHTPPADYSGNPSTVITSEPADKLDATLLPDVPTDGSGGEGQLEKVWKAAIGSSGKDSKQSLRYEPGEASESVVANVAERRITHQASGDQRESDYVITGTLGEGAQGFVYAAMQTAVQREVALKVIKDKFINSDDAHRQFFYEAGITAELDHPNIPPIYELAKTPSGLSFYSMKLIRGGDWQSLLHHKTREENLEILRFVANAVSFAHSRNIIHRDLKPDNVTIGSFGEVYVMDWGLAVDLNKTRSVVFGGTPDFMAPEMARNLRKKIGKHSDIYLLGAILFQILTGRPPHAGSNVNERLDAARRNVILETNENDPLMVVAKKAMRTMPEERYLSVLEFQAAIDEVLQHQNSIEMANRSMRIAETANENKDYDLFNRAIYGLKESIELWPDNIVAKTSLKEARLAFGKCAFEKGDYDLVLQTIDREESIENELYAKAERAKQDLQNREKRFRTMRNTFTVVATVLSIGLVIAFFVANRNAAEAIKQKGIAEANASEATEQKKLADQSAKEANEQKQIAEQNAERATFETIRAEENARAAMESATEALKQQEIAEANAKLAKDQERIAKENEQIALEEKAKALQALAEATLATVRTNLGLADSQARQANPIGASSLLNEIANTAQNPETAASFANNPLPDFSFWPERRVALLSNLDLPRTELASDKITALDFAPKLVRGILGTSQGELRLVTWDGVAFQVLKSAETLPGIVQTVTISPTASEAFAVLESANGSKLYRWDFQNPPTEVPETANRGFQGFSYSPDGSVALMGINQGVWKLQQGSWKNINDEIRGELINSGWVSSDQAYVVVKRATTSSDPAAPLAIYKLDRMSSDRPNAQRFELPTDIARDLNVVASLGHGFLAIGLKTGGLVTAEIRDTFRIITFDDQRALLRRHKNPIQQIASNGHGIIATRSDEPQIHVWAFEAQGGLQYLTSVSGSPSERSTTNRIAATGFIEDQTLLAIDEAGVGIPLDLERQQQRMRLSLTSSPSPALNIHPRAGGESIVVRQDGVVELWNVRNGERSLIQGEEFSYMGHTPGAVIVDSATNLDSGVLVTAAMLDKAEQAYIPVEREPLHRPSREFCVWDLRTGSMTARWRDGQGRISQPRLTLLDDKHLMIADRERSIVVDFQGNPIPDESFLEVTRMSPLLGIRNPVLADLLAVISVDGTVSLMSSKTRLVQGSTKLASEFRTAGLYPLQAAWSADGNRLYVALNTGSIVSLRLKDGEWSRSVGKPLSGLFQEGDGQERSVRILSPSDVDIGVATVGVEDRVSLVVRQTNFSQMVVVHYPIPEETDQTPYIAFRDTPTKDPRWFHPTLGKATTKLSDHYRLNSEALARISNTHWVGKQFFIASKSGEMVRFVLEGTTESIGRFPLVDSTTDRDGSTLWTLHRDGSVLKLDLSEPGRLWEKQAFSVPGATRISVSPDGSHIAILHKETGKISEFLTSHGTLTAEWEDCAGMIWADRDGNDLVVVHRSGHLRDRTLPEGFTPKILDLTEREIVRLQYFQENWINKAPNRYLVAHTRSFEGIGSDQLHFMPLDWHAMEKQIGEEKLSERVEANIFVASNLPSRANLSLVASPTESVFISGDSTGALSVWYALPTYRKLEELVFVENSLSSPITCVCFADDGDTIVAANANAGVDAWMSQDKLAK